MLLSGEYTHPSVPNTACFCLCCHKIWGFELCLGMKHLVPRLLLKLLVNLSDWDCVFLVLAWIGGLAIWPCVLNIWHSADETSNPSALAVSLVFLDSLWLVHRVDRPEVPPISKRMQWLWPPKTKLLVLGCWYLFTFFPFFVKEKPPKIQIQKQTLSFKFKPKKMRMQTVRCKM